MRFAENNLEFKVSSFFYLYFFIKYFLFCTASEYFPLWVYFLIRSNVCRISQSKPAVLWYHNENPANPDLHRNIRSVLQHGQVTLEDPQKVLHLMRVIKSPAEVELMKEACYIGSQSVNMAMACTKPGG